MVGWSKMKWPTAEQIRGDALEKKLKEIDTVLYGGQLTYEPDRPLTIRQLLVCIEGLRKNNRELKERIDDFIRSVGK